MAALPVTHIRWFARVHTTSGIFGTTNASVSSTFAQGTVRYSSGVPENGRFLRQRHGRFSSTALCRNWRLNKTSRNHSRITAGSGE